MYNANNFKTFTTEISDVVCHRLYGVEQNGRKVVLLEYLSLSLDANYEENACGLEIQEAINFLAFCNRKV